MELANSSVAPLCIDIHDRKHDVFSDDLYRSVLKLKEILMSIRSNCSVSIDADFIVAPNTLLTPEKWTENQKLLSSVMRLSSSSFNSKVNALNLFLNNVPQLHDVLYGDDPAAAFKRLNLDRKANTFIFQGYKQIMVCLHRHHSGSVSDFKETLSRKDFCLTFTAFKKNCPCGQFFVV